MAQPAANDQKFHHYKSATESNGFWNQKLIENDDNDFEDDEGFDQIIIERLRDFNMDQITVV